MCGELREEHVGSRKTLAGWVARRRDHGGLVFVDLRDRTGITQLVINPERAPEAAELAKEIRNEFVLQAEGEVVARAPEAVNPNLPTGAVELQVDDAPDRLALDAAAVPARRGERRRDPAPALPLARPPARQAAAQHPPPRRRWSGSSAGTMEAAGFLDIQTPILYKSTPEGARDFVVPSRLHKGTFFALPQSPQLLKQLTMIAGFDRYYQIAICFRDEDLRADRVQEITQLDVEMSFPDRDELFALMEETFAAVWRECLGIEIPRPFPHMTFAEADRRFGSDKPDTRFALEIEDATEATRGSEFGVFAGAEAVRFLRVPRVLLALRGRDARGAGEGARREGARLRRSATRRARSARRSRSSSPSRSSRRSRPAPGETLLFAADTLGDDVARPRRAPRSSSAASSG